MSFMLSGPNSVQSFSSTQVHILNYLMNKLVFLPDDPFIQSKTGTVF